MAINDDLRNSLEIIKTNIIDQQTGKGIRLTGRSAASLMVTRSRSVKTGRFVAGASLVSIAYLVTNFAGSGVAPGTFPPFGRDSELFKWVRQRGIVSTDSRGRIQTTEQTTFLIARSINEKGTQIYQNPSLGIDLQRIVADEMPETLAAVGASASEAIIEDFNKQIIKIL